MKLHLLIILTAGSIIVLSNIAFAEELTCENQIHNSKPTKIYNITPTSDGATVRWYQSPQIIDNINCGFPESYRIYVGSTSPISFPFVFTGSIDHDGFRGAYTITGLESNTTYFVDIQGEWGVEVTTFDEDIAFTTLSPGMSSGANNPIEAAKDKISTNTPIVEKKDKNQNHIRVDDPTFVPHNMIANKPIIDPKPDDFRESGRSIGLLYAYSGLSLVGIVIGFFGYKKLKDWNKKIS